jgi:hypothetical protein
VSIYLNGAAVTVSITGNTLSATILNSVPLTIGSLQTLANQFFPGYMDDVCIWSRALSAFEAAADYQLSRQGYPDVLNRLSNRVYSIPAATSTLVNWHRLLRRST